MVVGTLVLPGGITIIYGLNYLFKMQPGRRVALRMALAVMGILVMVYPSHLAKFAGILVFAGVFIGKKVVVRGLKIPFLKGVRP